MTYREGGGDSNEAFFKPSLFAVRFDGPLSNDEPAILPDDKLAAYLSENRYDEAKQRALEAQGRPENVRTTNSFE